MFWLPHIATSESVGLRCGPNLAVFVPVFWCPLCRRPLAGGGLGCVAPQGLGGCSTDDVHRQQLDQLPPVVLRPVRLDDVPPTTKKPTRPHISPVVEGGGWLSRDEIDWDDAFFTRLRIT